MFLHFNPFVSNAPFLYLLKTSCFQGVEKGCIRNEWVNYIQVRGPYIKVCHQIVSTISELISFYFPRNRQKTYGFQAENKLIKTFKFA